MKLNDDDNNGRRTFLQMNLHNIEQNKKPSFSVHNLE